MTFDVVVPSPSGPAGPTPELDEPLPLTPLGPAGPASTAEAGFCATNERTVLFATFTAFAPPKVMPCWLISAAEYPVPSATLSETATCATVSFTGINLSIKTDYLTCWKFFANIAVPNAKFGSGS